MEPEDSVPETENAEEEEKEDESERDEDNDNEEEVEEVIEPLADNDIHELEEESDRELSLDDIDDKSSEEDENDDDESDDVIVELMSHEEVWEEIEEVASALEGASELIGSGIRIADDDSQEKSSANATGSREAEDAAPARTPAPSNAMDRERFIREEEEEIRLKGRGKGGLEQCQARTSSFAFEGRENIFSNPIRYTIPIQNF